jgi:hypothetical protein
MKWSGKHINLTAMQLVNRRACDAIFALLDMPGDFNRALNEGRQEACHVSTSGIAIAEVANMTAPEKLG